MNSFIEELVVRRELSDNHCEYNEKYDSIGQRYEIDMCDYIRLNEQMAKTQQLLFRELIFSTLIWLFFQTVPRSGLVHHCSSM